MTRLREEPYTDMPTHNVLTGVKLAADARVAAERTNWSGVQWFDALQAVKGQTQVVDIEITSDVTITLSVLDENFCILRQGPAGVIWSANCTRDYGPALRSLDDPTRSREERIRTHRIHVSGDQHTFERDCMLIKVVGADVPDYSHVAPVRNFDE